MEQNGYKTTTKFDRRFAACQDGALLSKPSTIKYVEQLTGFTETLIIQTGRREDVGDFVFIEIADEEGLKRIALPPKAANAIAAQRDSLSKRNRSVASRRVMKARMEAGYVPTPPKRKPKKGTRGQNKTPKVG